MDYLIPNLRFLASRAEAAGQESAGKAAKVTQSAVSKIITGKTKEPGYRTVSGLARHFGVSLDDLVNRDLAQHGVSKPSQPSQLDPVRMGLALTSFDKALSDMEIQGQLGTLVEPLQFAYEKAFKVPNPDAKADRVLYDELVETHLRGWKNGRGRVVEASEGEDRALKAKGKKAGGGGRQG